MAKKKKNIKKNIVSLKENIEHSEIATNLTDNQVKDSISVIYDIKSDKLRKELDLLKKEIELTSNKQDKKKLESLLVLIKGFLEKELTKDLIISQIDSILNDMIKVESEKDIKYYKEKIRLLLKVYNEKNLKNAFDILNIHSIDDIFSQDKSLTRTIKDYKGFVYYFWNSENMNFVIIGLTQVLPLFEVIETQELFFLDKPTMSTKGLPIFWLNKGCPLSQTIKLSTNYKEMSENFTALGYNTAQINAMVKAPLFIRIFGLQKIPLKTWLLICVLFISFEVITILFCHIFYTG